MKDTLFQQFLKPLTKKLLNEATERFQSDYHYEKFNTFEHLKTMIYAQINEIKSLRTLEAAINKQKIGIKPGIKRSTLSDANKKRSADVFFWILEQLMFILPRKKHKEIKKIVRILDSSPIQLRGAGYDSWSTEYATRHIQGLKLHIEYDTSLKSPVKAKMSHPNCNDAVMGKQWPIVEDIIYVFDKGYYDYNWWWSIHKKNAYFVSRLKKNAAIVVENSKTTTDEIILKDCLFRLSNKVPRGGKRLEYQEPLRYISVKREGKNPLILVTRLKDLPAKTIAELYKSRWAIELFFKWIKQNLKLKKFLGKSSNAVKIQIATAIIAYILVQFFKNISGDKRSLYLVLIWVRHHLSTKRYYYKINNPPKYLFSRRAVQL